jgi:hypothetical protein
MINTRRSLFRKGGGIKSKLTEDVSYSVARLLATLHTTHTPHSIESGKQARCRPEITSPTNSDLEMDFQRSSQPGPSRPPRPASPHRRESSWEFGDFTAAPSNQPAGLEQGDLLGSFEDLNDAKSSSAPTNNYSGSGSGNGRTEADLLQDEGWTDFFAHHSITKPPERAKPMTIDLPPRPDEMPADYVPPTPPERMSQKRLSFSGPSSPPLVSHIGGDITFRPTPEWHREPVISETHPQRPSQSSSPRSPSQSKLMHTLATTTKMASKWKTVLDPSMFHPPSNQPPSRGFSRSSLDLEPPVRSYTDPIEVTHTTPFATAEQLAGTYIPPSGAPSYDWREKKEIRREDLLNEKWPDTKLVGRRAGTAEILTPHLADSLRQSLPPRQRLSNTWTLLCESIKSND